jgi:xanthine dehydrogenase accessory factor
MTGSVSGGCVEADVYERGLQVLESGVPVVERYGISDEMGVAVGLSCGGEIDVLIEPLDIDDAWQNVRSAIEASRPAALCVGISPAELAGRRLALDEHGAVSGTIAPGLDGAVIEAAAGLLAEGGQRTLHLPHEGGEARVFVEAFAPPRRLYIVGATHTAIPLSRMAALLGFQVHIVDPRGPFATKERFPDAERIHREWPDAVLDGAALDASCYVLTLTHDLKFDIPTLARALRSEVRYIGALGSRRTHERRKQRLLAEGFAEADLSRIHTPIGLDIGARSPEEIALAILAELVAVRHGRDGRPLVERQARIHGPEERDESRP